MRERKKITLIVVGMKYAYEYFQKHNGPAAGSINYSILSSIAEKYLPPTDTCYLYQVK